MATPASKLMMPTQFHEQQLAAERATENGRAIFTMWLIVNLIERSPGDFNLTAKCKPILAKFSNLTNLADMTIQFDQADDDFLQIFATDFKDQYFTNNVEHHEPPCRELWKSYFTKLWGSERFQKFEMKFAIMVVLPRVTMHDGNIFSISDNLRLFEELTKFLKEIELRPSLTQRFVSIYNSAGLTGPEKDNLLFSGKKMADLKHQRDVLAGKLTKAKEIIGQASFNLADERKRGNFLQQLLESQQARNTDLEAKIAELEQKVKACEQEIGKQGMAGLPICPICQDSALEGANMKLTGCCGHPIHTTCFDGLKIAHGTPNPPCPNCRNKGFILCPLSSNHPLLRQIDQKLMKHMETSVCEADFLEGVIGGTDFAPIKPPQRSIYNALLDSHVEKKPKSRAGGGARA